MMARGGASAFTFNKAGGTASQRVAAGHGGNLDPYLDPEAWYVLTSTDWPVDQVQHGHDLTGSAPSSIRGKNLGMVCSYNVGLLEANPSPVWRTSSAVSCVSMVNINNSGGDRWFASCEIDGGYNTWWKFGVGADGRACYGVNNRVGSEYFQWGPVLPTTGWHTFGWSRAADGKSVAVYVDGALAAASAAAMAPYGGDNARLSIGKDYFQPVQPYRQQMTALWLRALSGADMKLLSARIQGER